MTASTRVVHFYAGDSFAHGHYLTRKVPSKNGGKLERHYVFHVPAPHFVIDRVDAGRDQFDQHFAGAGNRDWHFLVDQLIDASVSVEQNCLHCFHRQVNFIPKGVRQCQADTPGCIQALLDTCGTGSYFPSDPGLVLSYTAVPWDRVWRQVVAERRVPRLRRSDHLRPLSQPFRAGLGLAAALRALTP